MANNSQDPRIGEILDLVSQLSDANDSTPQHDRDDLDDAIAILSEMVADKKRLAKKQQSAIFNNFAIQHVSDAVYWIDSDTIIRDVNAAACRMFGYSREEFIGKSVAGVDPTVTNDEAKQLWLKIKENGPITFETTHQKPDGSTFPVEVMVVHVSNDDINLNCAFARDISERKQTEKALRESNIRFQNVLQNLPIMIDAIDENSNFVFWNAECERITGYTSDEIINNPNAIALLYPDALQREQMIADYTELESNFRNVEWTLTSKSGEEKVISWSNVSEQFPVSDSRFWAVGVDVTEQHRAQDALRERESRLKRAESMISMGHFSNNIDGTNLIMSDGTKRIWGHDHDNLTSEDMLSQIHPDDFDRVMSSIREAMESHTNFEVEYRIIRPDKSIATVHNYSEFIYDENIQDYVIFGTTIDITGRKQVEEALRQNEARYRTLVESQLDLFSRYLPDTNLSYVNDAYCKFYGKTRDELIGTSFLLMVAPEFREYTREETNSLVKNPRTISGEYLNFAADGRAAWIHWIIQPILDDSGQVVELQAVGRDVTALKEAQEALRESKLFLQRSQQVARIGSYQFDVLMTTWISSPMLDEIYGIDDTYTKNINGWIALVHPDEQDEMQEYMTNHVLKKHNRFDKKYRIIRLNDREVRWVHGLGELEFDDQNQPVMMIGTIQDITERKQIEASLYESESRFSVVFNQSPDIQMIASVEPDGDFKIIAANNRQIEVMQQSNYPVKNVIGCTLHELLTEIFEYSEASYNHNLHHYRQAVESGEVVRFEDTVHTAQFGAIHSESTIAPIFDASHQCRYIVHSLRDITERKKAEEILRESKNRFSVVFNENADVQAIWSVEPDGLYRFVTSNNQFAAVSRQAFNVSTEDLIGKTLEDVLINELELGQTVYDYTLDSFKQAIKSDDVIRYEENFSTLFGRLNFETTVAPIFGSSNVCRYILYSAHDISERKATEEKIRQLNEELEQRVAERTQELERANEEIKHFAYIVSHDLRSPLVNLKGFSAELRNDLKTLEDDMQNVLPLIETNLRNEMINILHEDIPESLSFIESSVSTMDTFTKAILKLSRLGRLHLDLVDVDVDLLVANILESLSYQITQQGIKVTVGDLPVVTADLVAMEQILGNIIGNAITYLDPARSSEISITAEQTTSETYFHIQDNGRGIKPEDIDKVFAPFRRAGQQDQPGEGMGLAYVQTLVRRHGGQIWFESELEIGTTFTFTIPRNSADITPEL